MKNFFLKLTTLKSILHLNAFRRIFFSKKKNECICFGNPLICEYKINATFVVFYCYSLITVPHDDFHLYMSAIFIGT